MISLIKIKKKKLVEIRKVFNNDEEVKKHINLIKNEISLSKKKKRMLELENWLDQLD